MFQSFFGKLARRWTNRTRSAAPARSQRTSSFRPQLEGLEDRMVLSTASLTPDGTLLIKATAGTTAHQAQVRIEAASSGFTSVGDAVSGKILGVFTTNQIKTVSVTAPGNDAIIFDFTNGPMIDPGVTVTMLGGPAASNNAFDVEGGSLGTFEGFRLSSPGGLSTLTMGNTSFNFDSTFSSVDDQSINSNRFTLDTPAKKVQVDEGPLGQSYQVSSPGLPTVTFFNKSSFRLNMDGPSGSVADLNTSGACAGLQFFTVNLSAANQTINLNGEPSGMDDEFRTITGGDTINVAPVSHSLSSILGNLAIFNTATSPDTLNIHYEKGGADPQGISVQPFPNQQCPVQVNLFEPVRTYSFVVTEGDNNVLQAPVAPPHA